MTPCGFDWGERFVGRDGGWRPLGGVCDELQGPVQEVFGRGGLDANWIVAWGPDDVVFIICCDGGCRDIEPGFLGAARRDGDVRAVERVLPLIYFIIIGREWWVEAVEWRDVLAFRFAVMGGDATTGGSQLRVLNVVAECLICKNGDCPKSTRFQGVSDERHRFSADATCD